jgi:hypothetical protein
VFFGYPQNPPSHAETIRNTASALAEGGDIDPVVWESMPVDGKIIIEEVLNAIDEADSCVFDTTYGSDNVLFEAGYAIVRAKPVIFTIDTTVSTGTRNWGKFALLKSIGYTPYRNSADLSMQLSAILQSDELTPIYDTLIEPTLNEFKSTKSLIYCTTYESFEAASRLDQVIDERRRRGMDITISDPSESSLEQITWYAPKLANSAGIVVHFAGPNRKRSGIHNARHAFVAGMARGFDLPTLLLAEDGYKAAFDFEHVISRYRTSVECIRIARNWLDSLTFEKGQRWGTARAEYRSALSGLRFGEHVAENEMMNLGDYFVPTSAYEAALIGDAIYVGHRGTGKTASALQAFEEVGASQENLAVIIKPPGFEFPAIMALLRQMPEYQHDYFFDSLWRFILQTEIAAQALVSIDDRPLGVPSSQIELDFVDYIDHAPFDIRSDISVRLEQVLAHLRQSISDEKRKTDQHRNLINEALHTSALSRLRSQLGNLLKDKRRVAVFVDNLDKGWDLGADFKTLARLILGLLTARGRVITDFQKQDRRKIKARLSIAIFLRSDIYNYVRIAAREPDKLPVSMIAWNDPETLLSVIEWRYAASTPGDVSTKSLWTRFFVSHVNGSPTRDYLLSVILPRPRDIVYFCNLAVARALDRRHGQVEEGDIISAEEGYSQYAYEGILVENGVTIPEMENALLSFLGAPQVRTRTEIQTALTEAGGSKSAPQQIIEKLISMSFLGLEVRPSVFEFPEVGSPTKKALALAKKVSASEGSQRLAVHRAFHSFLEILADRTIVEKSSQPVEDEDK